ncbi:terpene synthase family protein [Actinomadura sp. PM05-2]|uniref:Terpene synthase n=1 Tax=Actinomadura parmotrematis TaxID=2864039 RepID=A0ABS7FKL9_9ACTN|nr:terpene synthase family protein [Actinomadura parmotrematis]
MLLSLTDRVPLLAARPGPAAVPATAPDAAPDAARADRLDRWARAAGLAPGAARCDLLAARLFPGAPAGRVELLARWLVWALALDDALDRPPLGDSGTGVRALYDDLLAALRRGRPSPGARPLESALVALWHATVRAPDGPELSRDWRRRFLQHLGEHRDGCAEEAVNRRTGTVPGPAGYPALRRRAAAPYLFDLAEPVLGAELPPALAAAPAWRALLDGVADILAWCNDLASYDAERERGDRHNHVAVLGEAYGFGAANAARSVADRIAERAGDVAAAARTLPATLERLRFTAAEQAVTERTVQALLDAPRVHLDWLRESGRHAALAGAR